MKKLSRSNGAYEKKPLILSLRSSVAELQLHRVDSTVLKASGILEVLKKIKDFSAEAPDAAAMASDIMKNWKDQVALFSFVIQMI
jgi:hypothetical protein